jgi:multidrug transporter EmrE-like cation transporter
VSAIYVLLTVALTVYGQLALKWHLDRSGPMPSESLAACLFLLRQLAFPLVISSFASAFLASLTWMAALTRVELSVAYPFMSLAFPLVALLSVPLFGEHFTIWKGIGTGFILVGLFLLSR